MRNVSNVEFGRVVPKQVRQRENWAAVSFVLLSGTSDGAGREVRAVSERKDERELGDTEE